MTARSEENCYHFTCVDIDEDEGVVWDDKDWEEHNLDGLEDASEAWLKTLGLMSNREGSDGAHLEA